MKTVKDKGPTGRSSLPAEGAVMQSRIQSPSSINTFRQCPRKYYYQYIEERPTRESIHLVRGKIVHSVLEEFFKIDIGRVSAENFDFELKIIIQELLGRHWKAAEDSLGRLGLGDSEVMGYLEETKEMVQLFILDVIRRIRHQMGPSIGLEEAFSRVRPHTEVHLMSEKRGVQGYIDAIHEDSGGVSILDYKTSASDKIREEYYLQLGIYALLYKDSHGKVPKNVGIYFLRHGERILEVDDELLEFARCECRSIHERTQSKDKKDYPKRPSRLCRWSSGQCDFYDICSREQ